jgi:hypothetical protein
MYPVESSCHKNVVNTGKTRGTKMNLLTLKLLASRKAWMRMLDVIEAMPTNQNQEKKCRLKQVERINALELKTIVIVMVTEPPILLLCLIFPNYPSGIVAFVLIPLSILALLQWSDTTQLEQIETRIKKIRHTLNTQWHYRRQS